jgi:hypothetical protein
MPTNQRETNVIRGREKTVSTATGSGTIRGSLRKEEERGTVGIFGR